ncbi:MAG: DUF1365 domain-containing protein [Deltaproteobacteria bacterium]|nr:MAG: DUF1365 domain-containing protein [Deltaproteobacteria bacterium]
MHSCLYEGSIRHRRFRPRPNMFEYRLFMMFLDLAELPSVFRIHPFWSYERFNIAYFRRRDHFGDTAIPLDRSVRDLVTEHLGSRPTGPIRLLTHLRYLGHCFNPASFYYCYDETDTLVETIVVEIHNTPWGEHHCYVLGPGQNEHANDKWRRYQFAKGFHVSPFIHMDIRYDWRFRVPGDTLRVHMIDFEKEKKLFDASLQLKKCPMSRQALTRVLIRYPMMTGKVITMIYWQALRLISKRTPFFTHPKKREPSGERVPK